LREAQTIASLGHANIVNVYDISQDETGFYIIMEYVSGPVMSDRTSSMRPPPPLSVEQYVKLNGPFTPDDCRQLLERLALALDYAHREGVIHRDIKPAHILLNGQFEPQLVDFG
jgi:serine/threonine-protein kinase